MKRLLAIAILMLAGCSSDDGATCETVTYDGTRYCVYEDAITETGYDCPPDMENMFRDEERNVVVCSPQTERPPFADLLAELDRQAPNVNAAPNNPTLPSNNDGTPSCVDEDGDGFGVGETQNCPKCVDEGRCGEDCDDSDPAANPRLLDTCDGIDNDCDGEIDEPLPCESAFDCPDEGGTLPTCDAGICKYRPPNQLGECGQIDALMCIAGQREQPPAECQ